MNELPFGEFALMLTREPLDDVDDELAALDARCLAWFRAWNGKCRWPRVELREGSRE